MGGNSLSHQRPAGKQQALNSDHGSSRRNTLSWWKPPTLQGQGLGQSPLDGITRTDCFCLKIRAGFQTPSRQLPKHTALIPPLFYFFPSNRTTLAAPAAWAWGKRDCALRAVWLFPLLGGGRERAGFLCWSREQTHLFPNWDPKATPVNCF